MKKIATGDFPPYLRRVKAACPLALRHRLMTDLENSAVDFLQEHPACTMNDLVRHFGTPEEFAATYVASMEDSERIALYKKHKRQVTLSLAAGSILILLIVGFCIYVVANTDFSPVSYEYTVSYTQKAGEPHANNETIPARCAQSMSDGTSSAFDDGF